VVYRPVYLNLMFVFVVLIINYKFAFINISLTDEYIFRSVNRELLVPCGNVIAVELCRPVSSVDSRYYYSNSNRLNTKPFSDDAVDYSMCER